MRIRLSEAAPAGGLTFTLTRLLGNNVPTGLCDDGEVKATAADLGASPPATLTVQAGQTEARVYYPVVDNGDDRVGRFECFAVQASTAAAGWPGTDDIELKIGTNQTTIAFGEVRPNTAVPDYAVTVLERIGTVSVPVTVNFLPSSSTTVAVEVVTGQGGGTATEGTNAQNPGDFLIATKSVTFGPSDATRTKMLSVAITDDTVHEQKETIVLRLTTTGQTSYVTQATGGRATLTIQDGLSAPRLLKSSVGDGVVLLEWRPPSNDGGSAITGYEVHYTSTPVGTVANDAAVQTGGSPSAADGWVSSREWEPAPRGLLVQPIEGLTNDTLYRVRVRARNANGPGAWLFGAVTPRAPARTPAAQPTDLSVTAGDAQLALAWTAPTGTVTGYDVHYTSALVGTVADAAAASGNDAAAAWVEVSRSGTAASQTISGLVNGRAYRVRVRAENADGKGAWVHGTGTPQGTRAVSIVLPSVSLSVLPDPVTEGSPVTVTATLSESQSNATVIPLTLTKGSAEDGDYGTPASITIAANALNNTGEITTAQDTDAEDETFTVALGTLPSGFTEGSPASIEVTVLDDDKAPLAPENLDIRIGMSQLRLTWDQPADTRTEVAAVSGYDVHYTSSASVGQNAASSGSDASSGWVDAGHRGTDTTHTITGLVQDRAYRVRVRAYNGNVEKSDWILGSGTLTELPTVSLSVDPNPAVTEGSPVTVMATLSQRQSSATVIPLRLTKGSAEDGDYGTLASITIAANVLSSTGEITTAQDTDAEDETFTVALGILPSGFVEGSPASIEVTILDDDEPSMVSLSVEPLEVDEGDSVTVTATLSQTRSSATVISLMLTKGSAEDGDYGTLASITIAANVLSGTGEITTAQDTDAEDETFTVALGILPSGFVEGSPASIEVTIQDDDKPLAPENLSVRIEMGQLRLTWDQPADTRTAVSGYEVHYTSSASVDQNAAVSGTDASSGWVDAGPRGTELEHLISELAGNTLYRVRVRAYNDKGKSEWLHWQGTTPVAPMVSLSVEPLKVDEGDSVTVTVTLTEGLPADAAIPLDLTNGSAEHGDYGTLASIAVAAGTLSASETISAQQDADVEDETFTVALGAALPFSAVADASASSAQVTIVDDDGPTDAEKAAVLKQSLEALAGTVLGSAVSTVSERVESSGQPSQPLAGDADGSSSLLRTLSLLFGLPQPGDPSAGVNETGHDRLQVHRAHRDEVASPAGRGPGAARYASGQLRLNAFTFSLAEPSDSSAPDSGGALVLWGRGDYQSFSGSFDDGLSYSGSWNSVYLGIDQGFGPGRLAGVALSVGRGNVNYRDDEGERDSGRYEARLRSVFPYFSAEVADGTRLWATFGYGRGEISNYRAAEEEPGAGDLRLGLAAVGAKHELNEWPSARLSLVGDAGYARLEVDSAVRPLEGLQSKVSRVRAGLEVSGRNSAAAAPYLRVSARFERGESARRKGLEAEGGIRWSGARHSAELHARVLRLRGNLTSYRETGVGASVYFRPSPDGTGTSLTLSHDWGRPRGSDTLWQNGSLSVADSQSATDLDSARSLNAELGYGLYSERLLGLVTPKLGWREDSAGERRLRIGAAYRANSWLSQQLGVEFGVHRRRTHSGVADYGGDLSASMSW